MGISETESSPVLKGPNLKGRRGNFSPAKRMQPSFTLDNRPTAFTVTNLPAELKTEEALKNHFKVGV